MPGVEKPKPDMNLLTVFLSAMLVMLSIGILFISLRGRNLTPTVLQHQPIAQQQQQMPIQTMPQGGVTRTEFSTFQRNVNQKVDSLDQMLKIFGTRVWLLGLAHNENTMVYQKTHPQEAQSYITLDQEWRISRIPEQMDLSPEQKQDLKNWVSGGVK
jgi:hypothetical protein